MGDREAPTYDPALFGPLFAIEDRHFWFRARGSAIGKVARMATRGLAPGYGVLEVGCGTGHTLRTLARACPTGTVVGMDLYAEGLAFARRRTSCHLVQGDVRQPPFGRPFDLIGAFDVIEHLDDDVGVLAALRAMLAERGALLLTVPAHPRLWSYFDEASQHRRRYTRATLSAALSAAGLRAEYLSHYMSPLVPMVWLGRRAAAAVAARREEARSVNALATSELRIRPGVNEVLTWILRGEVGLLGRATLPFGTSLIALCRRAG